MEKRKDSNDNQDDGNAAVEQTKTLPYGIFALSGAALLIILALCIVLCAKKKKDKK